MEITIYKTYEIEDKLWDEIICEFNSSFSGQSTDKKSLMNWYCSNEYGYSYHVICFIDDKLAGFNSFIPFCYHVKTQKVEIVYSGSTFVVKEFRNNVTILFDIFTIMEDYCKKNNIVAILAVPNKNSHLYFKRFLRFADAFNLDYYILPVKVFSLLNLKKLRFLNFLSLLFCYSTTILSCCFTKFNNYKEKIVDYRLSINNDFLNKRFISERYCTVIKKDIRFTYSIVKEEGNRIAYIMDFRENLLKSSRALSKCVFEILKKENVDGILYVGTMNVSQSSLIRVPVKFHPRKLHLTFKIIDETFSVQNEEIKLKENWDFSLINFDVR